MILQFCQLIDIAIHKTKFVQEKIEAKWRSDRKTEEQTDTYHPTGNSQCERLNQTLWKTVKLLLATHRLPESSWEMVLPDALHSIRSLLCTSTNVCPHDRFFKFERRSMMGESILIGS